VQDKRNENLSPLKNFTVRLVEDKLASIYESCAFAQSDLKDYPRLVRRATALGRHCIEPLALLSAMMMTKEDAELLALPVHPLQVSNLSL
jgi:transcriptional accessory protein Tex/SPT6